MSNTKSFKRKIENIEVGGEKFVMAFDMTSIDIFQDMTGLGILQSIKRLNRLEDKLVLAFIASTLRPVDNIDKPLGRELYNGKYDLLGLMIALIPTLVQILNEGFPQVKEIKSNIDSKKKQKMK